MKLTIKANNKINNVKVEKNNKKEIESVTINFNISDIWSDLEFWLNNANDEFLDYIVFNISKRNKIKVHK